MLLNITTVISTVFLALITLVAFVIILCDEADRIVQWLEDVDKGREQPPEYREPVFPKIPDKFWDKVGVKKAKDKTGGKRKGRAQA